MRIGDYVPTQLEKVREFHCAFGITNSEPESSFFAMDNEGHGPKNRRLRRKLLWEEFQEYLEAEQENDFIEVADALADMCYIIAGTALSYGIPLEKVFDEVHASNMRKLGPDGKPIYREDGKVIKPKDWKPPNIEQILLDEKTSYDRMNAGI